MDCNAYQSYQKNSSPYAKKVCCPNMKREAKKWAKITFNKKVLCIKTCCNNCIKSIQKSLDAKDEKFIIKNLILYKRNKEKKHLPVFKCQTLAQVKKNDKDAVFRN